LLPSDLDQLRRSGIDAALAERAYLRRVDSATGAQLMSRNGSGDYSGVLFPYFRPGSYSVREYRLRRDHPELEHKNGELKPRGKYLSPPDRPPMIYIVPATPLGRYHDTTLPIIITEGEKKCLALEALARHGLGDVADRPRWIPVAIAGVWSWRGKTGRIPGTHGGFNKIVGPINDFELIAWQDRQVTIVFDSNVSSNDGVAMARRLLAQELRTRGAHVLFIDVPADAGVNGINDLVGASGRDRVLNLLLTGAYEAGAPDLLKHLQNDHGNATRLIALYGYDLRYCYPFKKWLVWDGQRWAIDDTGHARRLAKQTMLEFLRQAINSNATDAEKFARGCLDARRIENLLSMAECELFIRPEELDVDPNLLNFQNGTVDLRTSELRPHQREDFITKLVHFDFVPDALCPSWLAFLDEIMGGGPAADEAARERAQRLTDDLQRTLGYSLTGHTIEKAVFVPFGPGDNGKSTLLSTVRQLIEEYAVVLQVDTLMVRQEI
jgi:hypothetical protein